MDNIYPIAETFVSPQGEGSWTGTLMLFIRFAGCTVGRPFLAAERERWFQLRPTEITLKPYQEKCCSALGEEFACDTNYRMTEKKSVEGLVALIPSGVDHVCLTGGEPLMHNLAPLVSDLLDHNVMVHIETSGTISFDLLLAALKKHWTDDDIWFTVSPKAGYRTECLSQADEIKILIGSDFDEAREDQFRTTFSGWIYDKKVCIQPINGEHTIDRGNMDRCLDLQRKYPDLRISTQMHKIWGVR